MAFSKQDNVATFIGQYIWEKVGRKNSFKSTKSYATVVSCPTEGGLAQAVAGVFTTIGNMHFFVDIDTLTSLQQYTFGEGVSNKVYMSCPLKVPLIVQEKLKKREKLDGAHFQDTPKQCIQEKNIDDDDGGFITIQEGYLCERNGYGRNEDLSGQSIPQMEFMNPSTPQKAKVKKIKIKAPPRPKKIPYARNRVDNGQSSKRAAVYLETIEHIVNGMGSDIIQQAAQEAGVDTTNNAAN